MIGADSENHRRIWLQVVLWLMVAGILWMVAQVSGRSTHLEVFSSGGDLCVTVDSSTLTAPVAVTSVNAIEIRTWASVSPTGGRTLVIRQGHGPADIFELPSTFEPPPGAIAPIGDWEVDNLAGAGLVFRRTTSLIGAFELEATFTGRVHQPLSITLVGDPTVSIGYRRGLINNDIFVWDERWEPIAVTSLDPEPMADLAAIAATGTRSAAAAALLVASFLALSTIGPKRINPDGGRQPTAGSRAWLTALVLGIAATAISLWTAGAILERLPHLPDSVVYVLQARWLLDGHLSQPISSIQHHLDIPFTYLQDGRWIAHYPFGWPALLAVGLALGAPWTVAPVLGGVYVVLLWWLGRTLYDDRIGLVAAALGLLSPLARIIFGSHLSHAASATFIVAFLTLICRARRTATPLLAVAAGFVLGLAFGVRPLSAIAVALPTGLLLLLDLRDRGARGFGTSNLAAVLLGGIAGTLPTLVQNLITTGSPFHFGYSLARGSMYGFSNVPFGIRNVDAILATIVPSLHGWLWGVAAGGIATTLPLAFAIVPFLLRRFNTYDLLLGGWFVCLMVVHVGTRAHGLHGFGARYAFDASAALYLLTARGFQELARMGSDREADDGATRNRRGMVSTWLAAAILLVVLVGSTAWSLPRRISLYRGYNGVDGSLERAVARAGVERGLILFTDDNWRDWAMASRLMTGPRRDDFVFARSLGDDADLWRAFPDLPVYTWSGGELARMKRSSGSRISGSELP